MLRLPELQRAFFRTISARHEHGDDRAVDPALAREVRSHGPLAAEARVGIYAGMYCARLVDALAEDYPRVAAVLGTEAFGEAAHAYVADHPSTHPSLRWFGAAFGDFLEAHPDAARPPFVADLARLEWARLAAFDAADAAPLDLARLRTLPDQAWSALRLTFMPCVRILAIAWPVHRIWEDPSAATRWSPEPTWLRVWRHDEQVFQSALDVVERTAIAHVRAGDDFATMCAGLAGHVAEDAAPATAAGIVLRWIEDGVLRSDVGVP